MIPYRDRGIAADALRRVNEVFTWERWRKDGCLPFDLAPEEVIEQVIAEEADKPHGLKPEQVRELMWETMVDYNHSKVKFTKDRDFADEEIWMACKCWLEQVDTGSARLETPFADEAGVEHMDYLTIIASVKLLKANIEKSHVKDRTWKARCWFGNWHYFIRESEDSEWIDIEKAFEGSLAA